MCLMVMSSYNIHIFVRAFIIPDILALVTFVYYVTFTVYRSTDCRVE